LSVEGVKKIVSKEYNDVYYSDDNGFEEKENVFIRQSNFTNLLETKNKIQVVELGFGLGINLANCYDYWAKKEIKPVLNYITIEKYPLIASTILEYHKQQDKSTPFFESFLSKYASFEDGWNETVDTETHFNILFFKGDVNEAFSQLPHEIDTWFLDGFSPSLNEEMWSETVFETMTKHSSEKSVFSTYSAAGFVRRGLERAGFKVFRNPGWGRKREMLSGCLKD